VWHISATPMQSCQHSSAVFDPTHAVYAVKGVTAIPLVEERARMAVNTLLSRNAALGRPSLLPSDTVESIDTGPDGAPEGSVAASATPKPLRAVQFARESQSLDSPRISTSTPTIKEEDDSLPPSPSGSGGSSTLSFELLAPNTPISQVIASKLSFWKPSLKPAATPDTHTASLAEKEPSPLTLAQEEEAIRDVVRDGKYESSVVLDSILSSPTPPPTSMEERHTELEQKIVRECIREFTKGGMYFAYTFGVSLLMSLEIVPFIGVSCQTSHGHCSINKSRSRNAKSNITSWLS
jgi:phosphatidylinositol 4-phosphatase